MRTVSEFPNRDSSSGHMLSTAQLSEWCDAYKRAWETQNADLFVTLFTDDCNYRITPFTQAIPGRMFHEFWRVLAERQQDNVIEFEIFGWASVNRAMVNWQATTSTRAAASDRREGSGIFLLTFDASGRCSELREWQHWHVLGAPLEIPLGLSEFGGSK